MRKTFISLFCVSFFTSFSQGDYNDLGEVKIVKSVSEKFTSIAKVEKVDSLVLEQYQTQNLSELIQEQTPIYLKGYGLGQLSTVSFRGTGSSHTAVLWNGVSINSLTHGQSDFSLLPIQGIDDVTINYGGNSSVHGSGAVGGSIALSSNPRKQKKGFSLSFGNSFNSLNNWTNNLSLGFKKNKIATKSVFYSYRWKNEFDYVNRYNAFKQESLKDAGINQYGVTSNTDIYLKKVKLFSMFWFNKRNKNIQESLLNSLQLKDIQKDKNIKFQLGFKYYIKKSNLTFRYSKVIDDLFVSLDEGSLLSTANTKSTIYTLEYLNSLSKRVNISSKIAHTNIHSDVSNYTNNNLKEHRTFANISNSYQIFDFLKAKLTLQYERVTGFNPEPTYSIGLLLNKHITKTIVFKSLPSVSKAYRLPSLNDRFWTSFGGEGNPNVKPERSKTIEWTNKISYTKKKFNFIYQLTAYETFIDDYILWSPINGQFWSPNNLQKVRTSGFENNLRINFKTKKLDLFFDFMYAYTKSNLVRSNIATIFQDGRQLWYVPLHKRSHSLNLKFKHAYIKWSTNYTGARGASSVSTLPAFTIHSVFFEKNIKIIKNTSSSFGVNIHNLFNEDYELYNAYVQPKRYLEVQLKLYLNNKL